MFNRKFTPFSMKSVPGSTPLRHVRLILVAAAVLSAPLSAATIYKDGTTLDLLDVAGWSTSGSAATPDPASIGSTDTLRFNELFAPTSGVDYLVSLDSNLTVGAIRTDFGIAGGGTAFGNVVISGSGVLTLGGNNDYATGTPQSIVLNSATGGSLTINNRLVLSATQRWVVSRNFTANGNVNLGSSTLEFNTAGGTTSITGVISGAGSINKVAGGQVLNLSNTANTFTGSVTLVGGTTRVAYLADSGVASSLGQATGAASNIILNGAVLEHTGSTASVTNRVLDMRAGSVIASSGSGTVDFTATNVLQGGTASARSLTLSGSNAGNNYFRSVLSDSGTSANISTLSKGGAGAWILTSAHTYKGATIINQGRLVLGSGAALGGASGGVDDTGNIVFGSASAGARLEFSTVSQLGPASQVRFRNTGGTAGQGGALVFVGETNQTLSKVLQSDSSIGIRVESDSVSGALTLSGGFSQSNRPLFLGGSGEGDNTLVSDYAGTSKLTKTGTGKWILSGSNSYSGGTELLQGILRVNALSGIGSGYLAVKNGATFVYAGSGSETTTRNLFLDLGASAIEVSQADAVLTWNDGQAKNGAFTKQGAGTLVLGGGFSGSAAIRVEGGLLTLNGTNTNTGKTTVTSGTLRATQASSLGMGTAADSLTLEGGTVALARDTGTTFGAGTGIGATLTGNAAISVDRGTAGAGVAHQIGALNLGGRTLTLAKGANVTSGAATLVLGGALSSASDSTVALGEGTVLDVANAASTGGTSLTKSGAGTLILRAGSNLGGLNVTGGRVDFASATSLGGGEGTLAFADGTSFDNTSGGDVTFSSSKSLAFAGTVTFLGSASLGLGSGSGALSAATTLQVQAGTLTLGGDLTGAFGLTKAGAGTLVLSGLGASTAYSGDTLIGAGELSLVNGSSFRSGTTVTLSSGATLRLGSGSTLGGVTLVNNGGTLITTDTIAAPITYASDLTLSGSNNIDGIQTIGTGTTVTLSGDFLGTNPGTPTEGRIVISGGATLRATQTFTIGANKGITLGAGAATLSSDAGKSLVIESVLSGAGSLVKSGAGGLRLTGANTFAGDVTIQGGTLGIASDASLGAGSAVNLDGGTLVAAQGTSSVTVSSARAVTLSGGKTSGFDATTGGSLTYDGAIGQSGAGAASLRIGTAGARLGTVYLGGTNTYTGTTTVAAGTLVLKSGASLGSGSVSVGSGATLANQGTIGGAVTASAGSTLKGTGTFEGLVTVQGVHAPGNSPGIQVFEDGVSFASSSILEWEFLGNALATRGTDYDGVDVTGGLLTVDPAATLKVINLSSVDYSASAWAQSRTFEVVSITGATFGTTYQFGTLDLSAAGNYGPKGSWNVLYTLNSTDGVYLQWTPVPEPGTYGIVLGLLGLAGAAARRRRLR